MHAVQLSPLVQRLFIIDTEGWRAKVVRDSAGNLIAVYVDGTDLICKTSVDNGRSWSGRVIATEAYPFEDIRPDLAIDSNDVAHVVYAARTGLATERTLYYMYRNPETPNAWSIKEDIFGSADRYDYPEIAIDSVNDIHCIFNYATVWNDPWYVKRTSGVWGAAFQLANKGSSISVLEQGICVDVLDNVHVHYYYGEDIFYRINDGIWQAEEDVTGIDAGNHHLRPEMCADSVGDVHLLYRGRGYGTYPAIYQLLYKKREGGVWQPLEILTDESNYQGIPSLKIALDQLDIPHVCYTSWGVDDFYINKTGGVWSTPVSLIPGATDSYSLHDMVWAGHPVGNILASGYMVVHSFDKLKIHDGT